MANLTFEKATTALIVVDPYNDFISEGGKVWSRLKTVAEANHCVPNPKLRQCHCDGSRDR